MIAVASADGKVSLYDTAKSTLFKKYDVDDNAVWSVSFSPDGQRLATASSDEVVSLWDIATGRQLAEFAGHAGGATDVVYLADGVTLVAVDRSGNLHLWDARSGRRLTEPWPAHEGASWRIALHPDGKQFSTSGDDGRVKLWDELSVARACEIGGLAFDETRRQQYLGDAERSVACDPGF
jgi:WD40 repeat protein